MKRRLGKIAVAFLVLVLATGAATRAPAPTPTFTVLHPFTGTPDGAGPDAALLRDAAGNLYGTTNVGGAFPSPGGTVFKLDTSGNETVLYSFTGGSDGCRPQAALIMDQAGNLYSTTTECGAYPSLGTLFKLDSFGNLAVLHSFTCSDGFGPGGPPLVMDTAGNLYGTTPGNSGNGCGLGTVFKLDTLGNYTVLHSFTGGSDGASPSGVIMDAAGNLYGATSTTIFRIDTSGNFTVLCSGCGGGPLLRDQAGNLYGTTSIGGAPPGFGGTVFKLDTSGNMTVLYNYAAPSNPSALIMDKAGNLYGVTGFGGSFNCSPTNSFGCGTVFKLDTLGNYTVLHNFTGGSDGAFPGGGLVMDPQTGNLYGTASSAGVVSSNCPGGCGTVFKLTVQVAAHVFVDIKPQSCPNPINVGAEGVLPVAILGTATFDVTKVDPSSVKLQGVGALRSSLEDVATPFTGPLVSATSCTTAGPDGFLDLVLFFSDSAVSAALGTVTNGQVLELTLTGNLKPQFGGNAITGQDVVVINQ
jgi:uncharacterized repeat protein (TIGR03803 family)